EPATPADADAFAVALEFLEPRRLRLEVRAGAYRPTLWAGGHEPEPDAGVEGAWLDLCELAVPFAVLGSRPGEPVTWLVSLERAGRVLTQVPEAFPFQVITPGPDIEAWFWTV